MSILMNTLQLNSLNSQIEQLKSNSQAICSGAGGHTFNELEVCTKCGYVLLKAILKNLKMKGYTGYNTATSIKTIYNSDVTKFMSAGYNLKSSKNGIKLADKYEYI